MSKRKATDETLYCEHCGISFLWSSEEQRPPADDAGEAAAWIPRPQLCPGCTRLLPQGGRQRGLVKWFNHRAKYGFLARTDKPDLFVHRSAVAGNSRLRPGDLVEFTVSENDRGPVAVDVVLLAHSSSSPSN